MLMPRRTSLQLFGLLQTIFLIYCKDVNLLKPELLSNEIPKLEYQTVEQTPIQTMRTTRTAKTSTASTTSTTTTVFATATTTSTGSPPANPKVTVTTVTTAPPENTTTTPTTTEIPISITTPVTEATTTVSENPKTTSSIRPSEPLPILATTKQLDQMPHFLRDFVIKRAVPVGGFKNGVVPGSMVPTLRSLNGKPHEDSVRAFNRELYHGSSSMKTEYVGLWWPSRSRAVWGKFSLNEDGTMEGSFLLENIVRNTSEVDVFSSSRSLIFTGTKEENNFSFTWVNARLLDPTTVVTVANGCPQFAPAVYTDTHENYEFLGEADIVNRKFHYVQFGKAHEMSDRSTYLRDVYVLTKQRCSCSCDSDIVGGPNRL